MYADQYLPLARQAIQRGDEARARQLLIQAVRANPKDERAWLWLSAVIGDPDKEKDCLRQVLKINPHNEKARQHLARLEQPTPAAPVAPGEVVQPVAPVPAPVPAVPPAAPTKPKKSKTWIWILIIGLGSILCCLFGLAWLGQSSDSGGGAAAHIEFVGPPECEYIRSLGDWKCEGRVTNTGTRNVKLIQIRATITDSSHRQVGTEWTYADPDVVPPKGTSGYTIYVSDPTGGYERGHQVRVVVEGASY
jgi:hypothetical protein